MPPTKKKVAGKKSVTRKEAVKKTTAKKSAKKKGLLDLFNGEQYPQMVLASIEVAKRVKKNIFFNPRALGSFDPIKMAGLLRSIRLDGLLEPIVVAVSTTDKTDKNDIDAVMLIAGERRYRCLCKAVDGNLPCYDTSIPIPDVYAANAIVVYTDQFAIVKKRQSGDEVEIELLDNNENPTGNVLTVASAELLPTVPAKKVYTTVAAKVYVDPSEERMMRLAVTENQQSEPLKPMEEILACERLSTLKCEQERISYMLDQNITWVSQTLAFREQLPEDCFEALMEGRMKRNVAVSFLAYDIGKRQKLFDNTVLAEESETANRIKLHRAEQEQLEDQAEMLKSDAQDAEVCGDGKKARRLQRKSASKERHAKGHSSKADRAEGESGQIKQGHVQTGAAIAGISTRKAKMLPKAEIKKKYVDELESLTDGETEDPVCKKMIPGEVVRLVRATAEAILSGEREPLLVIRTHMIETAGWDVDGGGSDPNEEEDYEPVLGDDGYDDGDDDAEERDIDSELAAMSFDDD